MPDDERLDEFWDAALDGDQVDYEAFLAEGGEGIPEAVAIHRLLQHAARDWQRPARPSLLGRFEVLGDLGAGGLGRVYLAWDPELKRQVAIKVIARDRWAVNEARAIARLDHRSIVKVYEVGHDRLVMELLDGGSLQDAIEAMAAGESTHLDSLRARQHCLVRIAEGLAYCHERGILHRDVKPGNVLFARDDEHPRLVDFGLAHLDEEESLDITQNLVGSPAYLAPEQVDSGETGTDPRTDVFSFGVLIYELLTLECPFKRDTRTATLDAVMQAHPRPPREISSAIPKPLVHIIEHCLELDPRDRYQTIREVVDDLQNVLADRPISVGGRSLTHRAGLTYQRNRRVTRFAMAGIIVTMVAAAVLWGRAAHAERAEFRAGLETIDLQLLEHDDAMEFIATGLKLGEAAVRAQAFDRDALASAFSGSVGPSVAHIKERWSRRLGSIVTSIENDESGRRTDEWKSVFQIDANLLPDAEWNRKYRNRGRVTLVGELAEREDLIFLRQEYRGTERLRAWIDLKPIPFEEYPRGGRYRVRIPNVWEREFNVSSIWQEEIKLRLTDLRLPTEGWMTLPKSGLIASPLITNCQYLEFCRETQREGLMNKKSIATEPYVELARRMEEFANWVGGSLPAAEEAAELLSIYGTPKFEFIIGEFVCDAFNLRTLDIFMIEHAVVLELPDGPPIVWASSWGRDEESSRSSDAWERKKHYGFRVVYQDPSR